MTAAQLVIGQHTDDGTTCTVTTSKTAPAVLTVADSMHTVQPLLDGAADNTGLSQWVFDAPPPGVGIAEWRAHTAHALRDLHEAPAPQATLVVVPAAAGWGPIPTGPHVIAATAALTAAVTDLVTDPRFMVMLVTPTVTTIPAGLRQVCGAALVFGAMPPAAAWAMPDRADLSPTTAPDTDAPWCWVGLAAGVGDPTPRQWRAVILSG